MTINSDKPSICQKQIPQAPKERAHIRKCATPQVAASYEKRCRVTFLIVTKNIGSAKKKIAKRNRKCILTEERNYEFVTRMASHSPPLKSLVQTFRVPQKFSAPGGSLHQSIPHKKNTTIVTKPCRLRIIPPGSFSTIPRFLK